MAASAKPVGDRRMIARRYPCSSPSSSASTARLQAAAGVDAPGRVSSKLLAEGSCRDRHPHPPQIIHNAMMSSNRMVRRLSVRLRSLERSGVAIDKRLEPLARLHGVEQLTVKQRRVFGVRAKRFAHSLFPALDRRMLLLHGGELAVHAGEHLAALVRIARGGVDGGDELALPLAEDVVLDLVPLLHDA